MELRFFICGVKGLIVSLGIKDIEGLLWLALIMFHTLEVSLFLT
jgi:hypothetical protein